MFGIREQRPTGRRAAGAAASAPEATSSPPGWRSILFPYDDGGTGARAAAEPTCFRDLNLDRVVAAIAAFCQDHDITPYFHRPLQELESVVDRQATMRDLEQPATLAPIQTFCERLRTVRQSLERSRKGYYRLEKQRWHLGAAEVYTQAVDLLGRELAPLPLASRGLASFRDDLARYRQSRAFQCLLADSAAVSADLGRISYGLVIRDSRVAVRRQPEDADYRSSIEAVFERFRRGEAQDYRFKLIETDSVNHIQAQILDRVARFHPEEFRALEAFCDRYPGFLDEGIARFDREIRFYLAYLRHIAPLRAAGLPFCYPVLSRSSKEIDAADAFDLALAARLHGEGSAVVRNDFELRGPERIIVVSGPNQGGKTTFARMIGQMHYLASLGCPVPGSRANLYLCDRIFTHFEREESVLTLRGKLKDELVRIKEALDMATPDSLVLMNEMFSSTALEDQLRLGRWVLARVLDLDLLAVCVTFLTELSTLGEKTVSMVGRIDPADPATRTFKVERRAPDGLAYALAIADKYQVTYEHLTRRIPS